MIEGQLWKLTDSTCRLASYVDDKGTVTIAAPNVPLMFWPDGQVCWPVTMWLVNEAQSYLGSHRTKGKRNSRGGTTPTNASLISHLVRYTFKACNKDFTCLADDNIKAWVADLRKERDEKNPLFEKRKDTQVGRIVRKGLMFLLWYQHMMLPNDCLIGPEKGHQITIEDKSGSKPTTGGRKFSFTYVTHRYIPNDNTPQKVKPIGHAEITKLYAALCETTPDPEIRKRDENILRLLEATGGRRVEIADMTVADLRQAYESCEIPLQNAKSNNTMPRKIPISKEWLEPVMLYIRTFRKKLVQELIMKGKISEDPEFMFISTTTGKKLSETTITRMISRLRRAAGISDKLCAHMFRHRFITIQVATRLKGYAAATLPLDLAHTILTKVSTLSGHSDPKNLDTYIDLAFEELGIWDTSEKVLAMRSKLEGAYRQIQTLKNDLNTRRVSNQEFLYQVDSVLAGLLSSLEDIPAATQ